MVARLIIHTLIWFAAMGLLLFLPAGTLAWPAAWFFLAEMLVLGLWTGLSMARRDPGLLNERLGSIVQSGQAPVDKLVTVLIVVLSSGWLAFMALDAMRFGWSSVPAGARALGAVAIALSGFVGHLAFRENSFAAPVVKIQAERGQTVISTGPYAYVRHPMYAGALLFFVGTPLLLGSWWGLALAPLLTAMLVARILVEERTLKAGLPGYEGYVARVRYRLIPGIW